MTPRSLIPTCVRSTSLALALTLVLSAITSAAESMAGHLTATLRPIGESVQGLDLSQLEALPVQHGGRYKPFLAFGMELVDGINGQSRIGPGHTPLTSALDLLFCRNAYEVLPVVIVKNADVRRDLAPSLPAGERERFLTDGALSPNSLASPGFQTALSDLGRQTIKTKALNQVNHALASLDAGRLLDSLRLLPVPAGDHRDTWRNPIDVAPDFTTSLGAFVQAGQEAGGDLAAYGRLSWALLPIAPETASRLDLNALQVQQINHGTLWTLWKAAGSGKITQDIVRQLVIDPQAGAAAAGIPTTDAAAFATGLTNLSTRWHKLQVPAADLADATTLPTLTNAIAQATLTWNALGSAWSDARRTEGHPDAKGLQAKVDAFTDAITHLRTQFELDRARRGQPPLTTTTALEVAYWNMNGFSGVAWCFLLAIPFLALGAIGGSRWGLYVGFSLAGLGLIGQLTAFIIRWILAQRIPLANLYESMAAAALLCSIVALVGEAVLWSRRRAQASTTSHGALALAAALFGCLVVLAQAFLERHDINAFISPAMPILSEFWLRIHTACIVSSYGIIGLGGLMSAIYLMIRIRLPSHDPRCESWERTAFAVNCLATVVLWIGLVLGAVWAAVSWGRPWGWDPKEVFALLTWVVFIILVHLRHAVPKDQRGVATAWASLIALIVMAFNWYWVNVQLSGLHSYA